MCSVHLVGPLFPGRGCPDWVPCAEHPCWHRRPGIEARIPRFSLAGSPACRSVLISWAPPFMGHSLRSLSGHVVFCQRGSSGDAVAPTTSTPSRQDLDKLFRATASATGTPVRCSGSSHCQHGVAVPPLWVWPWWILLTAESLAVCFGVDVCLVQDGCLDSQVF